MDCTHCGAPITPGERRVPTTYGARHEHCSVPGPTIELYDDLHRVVVETGGQEIPGTVAGSVDTPSRSVVRVELDTAPEDATTDVIEIESVREAGVWSDPEAFDMVPTFGEENGIAFVKHIDRFPLGTITIESAATG